MGANEENLAPLTAYTLVSLLETFTTNSTSLPKNLLSDTLPCLEVGEAEERDLYTTALTAYALALAGELENARQNVDWLLSKARRDNHMLWWEQSGRRHLLSHHWQLLAFINRAL